MHQLCSYVLDTSGYIPRLVFESKTDVHLLQYASTEKQLLGFCGLFDILFVCFLGTPVAFGLGP